MNLYLTKNYGYIILFLKCIIIFQEISSYLSLTECDYHTPIKNIQDNNCIEGFKGCNIDDNYESEICFIDNQLVKTQRINHFITNEDTIDYNYIDICTSLNRNIISLFTSDDSPSQRIFFSLKGKDGRDNFLDFMEEEIPFYNMDGDSREHINIFSIKLKENSDNKEYIISFSVNGDFEVYNFYDNVIYTQEYPGLFNLENIYSYVETLIELDNNDYFLGLIGIDSSIYFYIFKLNFILKYNIPKANILIDKKLEISESRIVSCFKSDKKYIVCFYQDIFYNYAQIIFDQELNELKNETIVENSLQQNKYFKCIHFIEEVGAFLYYDINNKSNILFIFNIFKS